jgi:DNA invertase Pin-like site-specific DNA recombinase
MVCRHLDGKKNNNSAINLAWGSQSQNNLDKERHGTAPHGQRNPMAKLTDEKVKLMKLRREQYGESFSRIAAKFNVSTMTAYRAITGQSWSKS